ncbi:hypothetical protein A3B05_00140 [Candidatus Giovannonibacteria bacterium RIFCSPLOWO2_01_FULL_43_160]|uniref:DUF4258 domain-containing protein n=2 Tax=Candidatus Giovannoniibacteriota TaxID=1752738 RepID=A0A1F5XY09_9BACT|nr:MAG: hypothetical protein A3C76_00175 [Candidatus Giovannonibacteria bacterium RIFCSPHIGHO2_02_FULL_44_51]OGF72219.1 MAG: hypothetical protein A3E35_01465 [Candidatus Giovannonibacteria bacterium RIFCSPHIGHO2_12_FULL_44_22]OGF76157.1 MAG: hypothetical protein A3B05_00140 [Candidatus Giovannonibacteria bacterium RIFCSPLOWO2_01_FULL_43_160]OGF92814.1 MAG: hypothetical protein A3H05_00630 [Candidatus Giovannonibacteria bacterium RIFCSPLOWO2_12_FULL_43_26]
MSYELTKHARERMEERTISKELIEEALRNPTKVWYDEDGRILIKKLYKKKDKERLLLIIGEKANGKLKIITIIETSKIKKYL